MDCAIVAWTYSPVPRMAPSGADEWLDNGREFAGVIYAHQLGITIGQAIRDLELIAKVLETEDMRSRIEFLPYS